MRRREFITLIGGVAAWPIATRAQQPERVRRIGVLVPLARDDPEARARLTTFRQALQGLGWTDVATCTSISAFPQAKLPIRANTQRN
jgi:putative tryptophan/tyrosine transport system substrate-binding protein